MDAASSGLGEKILGPEPEMLDESEFDLTLRSRILKDSFHVFNMFYISATHSLRLQFTRELRDAIFVPDQADKSRINSWGAIQNPPQTYNTLRNSSPQWIRERCKHIIPAPKMLRHLVSHVFRTYGPLIDPKTKKPLFTTDNWKTAKHVLDLIQNGYLSDPPGIPPYTVVGLDEKAGGLPIYRCARGTNATEGGVHKHIRAQLPKCGASLRHVNAALHDFVLYHNLSVCVNSNLPFSDRLLTINPKVGTKNSTGEPYKGHLCIWITHDLQDRRSALQNVLISPSQITGWVNGNHYVPTAEVLGILPIPLEIRESSGMAAYVSGPIVNATTGVKKKPQRYDFLAQMQGTRKPVLPVHTMAEKLMFRTLMSSNREFNPPNVSEPPWNQAVKIWNASVDKSGETSGLYYKVIFVPNTGHGTRS